MLEPNVYTSEMRLVDAARQGDRDARRELFEQHRSAAYAVAVRIVGRHEDALDVVQDGFIRAFDRLSKFQGGSSFRTWLLRIVTNRALDLARSRKVRLAVSLDADDDRGARPPEDRNQAAPSRRMELAELGGQLQAAVDRLPPEQRAVFAMYATGEMTYGEIAETLGVPIGTVMSRLHLARKKLQEMLPDVQ